MLRILIFLCLVPVGLTAVTSENKSTCNLPENLKQEFNKCVKQVWSPVKLFIKDAGHFAIGLDAYEKIMRFPNKMLIINGACGLLKLYENCIANLIKSRNESDRCFFSNPKHQLLSTTRAVICRESDWQSAIESFDPCANAVSTVHYRECTVKPV